jgi:hypothetical protein
MRRNKVKLTNYSIAKDFIALEQGNTYLDLHNNFEFISLEYIFSERSIILKWVKSAGDWVPNNSPSSIILTFSGVYLFKSKERDPEMPFSEDSCLDSIGFIGNDLIEEISGFFSPEPAENQNHLNISFTSGFAVKIGAEYSGCVVF